VKTVAELTKQMKAFKAVLRENRALGYFDNGDIEYAIKEHKAAISQAVLRNQF
jgi:hypothetical protein